MEIDQSSVARGDNVGMAVGVEITDGQGGDADEISAGANYDGDPVIGIGLEENDDGLGDRVGALVADQDVEQGIAIEISNLDRQGANVLAEVDGVERPFEG